MAAIVVGSGGNNGEIWQDITDQLTWKQGKSLYSAQATGNSGAITYVRVSPYTSGHYDTIPVSQGEKYRVTGWVKGYSDIVRADRTIDTKAYTCALLDASQHVLALPRETSSKTSIYENTVIFCPAAILLTNEIVIPASASYLFLANLSKYFEEYVAECHSRYPSDIPTLTYSLDDFRLEKLVQ